MRNYEYIVGEVILIKIYNIFFILKAAKLFLNYMDHQIRTFNILSTGYSQQKSDCQWKVRTHTLGSQQQLNDLSSVKRGSIKIVRFSAESCRLNSLPTR